MSLLPQVAFTINDGAVCSGWRRPAAGPLLLIVVTWVSMCRASPACTICFPVPPQTVVDRVLESSAVAFARIHASDPFRYQVTQVVKGGSGDSPPALFVDSFTRRRLQTAPQDVVVLCRPPGAADWERLLLAEPRFQELLQQVIGYADAWQEDARHRHAFFMKKLAHPHRGIAELAYLEVGRAPYTSLRGLAHVFPRAHVHRYLNEPQYLHWRGLAILALARHAQQHSADGETIVRRAQVLSRSGQTRDLAAWLTAWMDVGGPAAIRQMRCDYLEQQNRTPEEIRAVLTALRMTAAVGSADVQAELSECLWRGLQSYPHHAAELAECLVGWPPAFVPSGLAERLARPGLVQSSQRELRIQDALLTQGVSRPHFSLGARP